MTKFPPDYGIGQRFGNCVMEGRFNTKDDKGVTDYWARCLCDCGKQFVSRFHDVRRGAIIACGCVQRQRTSKANRRHGWCGSRVYNQWVDMKRRCYDTTREDYPRWGGRGITVCDRWRDSFENFLEDMGESPRGMTLDRISSKGNYEPDNCRWATPKVQANNMSRNVRVTMGGENHTISEWADKTGVKYDLIQARLKRGLKLEDALNMPLRYRL